MTKEYRNRQSKAYEVDVEVKYLPFPDEKRREEAYDTHARLFLKAKERMLKVKKGEDSTTRDIVMNSQIKEEYKVIDEIIQEVMLAEKESLCGICALLEEENVKFNSEVIREIIAILRQWNKIPTTEIRAKVEAISKKM